jgi:hypothetical protein
MKNFGVFIRIGNSELAILLQLLGQWWHSTKRIQMFQHACLPAHTAQGSKAETAAATAAVYD